MPILKFSSCLCQQIFPEIVMNTDHEQVQTSLTEYRLNSKKKIKLQSLRACSVTGKTNIYDFQRLPRLPKLPKTSKASKASKGQKLNFEKLTKYG